MKEVSWRSPSNIAIVKYWGKYGRQLPRNTSLSLTLSKAHTNTAIKYSPKNDDGLISLKFFFEGKLNPKFGEKTMNFFDAVREDLPFLTTYAFEVHTDNTFPHSSGIASSASGMSAIALGICQIESLLSDSIFMDNEKFRKRASFFSRLGSGSACRSVYPIASSWGKHPDISDSSDEFATPLEDQMHSVFNTYHDDILIVSRSEKSVSSTAGHSLMNGNPFAEARYKQANERITLLLNAMKTGDLELFGKIAENEALTLHALMMCSDPSYVLMEPNTLAIISEIRNYRKETSLPIYFTLDAGPNIHLLYPDSIKTEVDKFVTEVLIKYCDQGKVLKDQVGLGSLMI